jgi:hypothetical protein
MKLSSSIQSTILEVSLIVTSIVLSLTLSLDTVVSIDLWLHILDHEIFVMLSPRQNFQNPKGSAHLIFYKLATGEFTWQHFVITGELRQKTGCATRNDYVLLAYACTIFLWNKNFHPVEIVATLVFIYYIFFLLLLV